MIKPSGVPYDKMRPEDLVAVDLDGRIAEGKLRPSSDLATHLVLYRAFADIGGVVHTHSRHATAWAQAGREIPCLGTTHADYFYGAVPVTRPLTPEEIVGAYEENTGHAIVERFRGMDPMHIPAALVTSHGPFCWGRTAGEAAHNAVILEEVAQTAVETLLINAGASSLPRAHQDKHFLRKHGPGAYYGQK
jgi:L-ribulose-5-phosphate 4-epimerase